MVMASSQLSPMDPGSVSPHRNAPRIGGCHGFLTVLAWTVIFQIKIPETKAWDQNIRLSIVVLLKVILIIIIIYIYICTIVYMVYDGRYYDRSIMIDRH